MTSVVPGPARREVRALLVELALPEVQVPLVEPALPEVPVLLAVQVLPVELALLAVQVPLVEPAPHAASRVQPHRSCCPKKVSMMNASTEYALSCRLAQSES